MDDHSFETALVLGDFEVALPLLEDMTCEEQSHLTLPNDLTPLHYACQHGRVDVAKLLLNNYKYSIERRDVNGCTPLHTATQYGQLEVFKYLLQVLFTNGETHLQLRIDSKLCHTLMSVYQQTLSERHRDLSGNTPLHTASKHGSVDIIQLLIQEIGCDLQERNRNDMSSLDLAAQYGHLPLVKYLTTQHCDLLRKSSTTSLLHATKSGHLDVVKFFIEELQCNTNSKDAQEMTLLHHASKHGHLNTVKYLVETQKCDPLCPDENANTPLHVAASFGHLEVVKYFTIDQNCYPPVKNADNNTPLHLAVIEGRLDVMKFLIEDQKYDPNSMGELKRVSLHLASMGGHLNTIKYLVETQKCDLKCPDENANTPLHVAASTGHLEVVKYFTIDQHCDPLVTNSYYNTPLHLAALEGRLDVVKFLIEDLKCDPNSRGQFKETPLHLASQGGHVNTIKYLVETQKSDILCPDENADSPLHVAAFFGHLEVVKYFTIDKHCDPLVENIDSNTPLHLAAIDGRLDVVKFLIETLKCNLRMLLHFAIKGGHLMTIKYLVETQKYDPLCPDENADSPLHVAAFFGHLEVVKYFTIDQHCNPLVKNAKNNKPLHLAALEGRLDVVKFLIEELKCDPNSKSHKLRTALHHASKGGHLSVINYLVERQNCDLLCPDNKAFTPLHIAAFYNKLEAVTYYTRNHNIDPLVQDINKNTPLHLAAQEGNIDIVKFFVDTLKCNPNYQGQSKKKPLHFAIENDRNNVTKFLVDHENCNILSPDSDGITPFFLAVRKGHLEIVKQMMHTHRIDPYTQPDKKALLSSARDSGMLEYFTNYVDPLHQSAINGDMVTVRHYIERVQWCPLVQDRHGNNLLHTAAKHGELEVVTYLTSCNSHVHAANDTGRHLNIDQQCDPLVKNAYNNTPLHLAALEGRLDVMKFLIEDLKCNPDVRGELKATPLHFASKRGFLNIVLYLVETQKCDLLCPDENANTPLHVAALYNKLEVVMYFTLNHNIDPLVQDITNNTPLHSAALKGNIDIVNFFIDVLKSDLNCEGQSRKTPLHLAIENGNNNVSRFLVDHKQCNILSPDSDGITPFLLAIRMGNHKIVKQMMHTHRIDPYTQQDQKTLLSAARYSGMLEYFANYVDPLHQAAINGDMDTVRHYIERVQWSPLVKDRHGNNLLHIAAKRGQLEAVKYLIDFSHKNTSCPLIFFDFNTKNKDGLTAQQLAENKGFMHVVSYLRQASDNQPNVKHLALPPSVNILVMGNSGSGKSTLIKALSQGKSIFGRLAQVKGVQPLTAGIIPTTISSQDFGKVNIYDFAGHEEYYASHEMILHQTTQPLVLIAVNTSLSMADIEKQLCYWLSTLSNAKNDHAMHVLVIGSHADKTSNACIQEVEQNASLLAGNDGGIIYHGFVHCDCRYSISNGMSQLRHMLNEVCTSIRFSLSYSDTSFSNRMCTSLKYYLDSHSPDDKAASMTIDQLQQKLKSIEIPSPNLERLTDQELLVQTCESLSANGHLIFLSNDTDVGKSLLLTDEKTILSKVHACLGRIDQSINSLGILEEQQLKEILTSSLKDTMDPSLAVKYLLIAQFCTKVTPDQLTSVPHGVNEQATHYFFPNLVLAERPAQLWTSAEEDKYTHLYTWCLRCSNARHFFTPRYLHTLFIQLIKCDTTGNAKYTIWKNGILLVHGNGTRCMIEVVQTTQLFFAIQCVEGCEQNLVKQRSLLISLIRSLINKICPKLELDEVLFHPQSSYPPTVTTEIPISAIASSVALGYKFVVSEDGNSPQHVSVSDLLYFDPFHKIRPYTLQEIFINRHSNEPVPYLRMRKVYAAVEVCEELVERFHNDSGSSIKEITYQQLYEDLLEFSIFRDEHIQNMLAQNDTCVMEEEQDTTTHTEPSHPTFNSPLELVDLYEVNIQLVSVTKWKEFGQALGLSRPTLEKIEAINYQSVEQCLTEVLAALLKGQDRPHNSPLNWREVIDTLNSPTLNMRDCAKTLVQKLMRDKDEDNGVPTARDNMSTVNDGILDSHSLMEVKRSLFSLKHKWFHIGLSLGLSYYTLKIIEQSPSEDCLTEVLVKWLDQADMTLTRGPPSWRSLAVVLDCPLVQEHDVARNIKKDHPMDLISL